MPHAGRGGAAPPGGGAPGRALPIAAAAAPGTGSGGGAGERCRALYDFHPERPTELSLRQGAFSLLSFPLWVPTNLRGCWRRRCGDDQEQGRGVVGGRGKRSQGLLPGQLRPAPLLAPFAFLNVETFQRVQVSLGRPQPFPIGPSTATLSPRVLSLRSPQERRDGPHKG